jgi:hypothetical protein
VRSAVTHAHVHAHHVTHCSTGSWRTLLLNAGDGGAVTEQPSGDVVAGKAMHYYDDYVPNWPRITTTIFINYLTTLHTAADALNDDDDDDDLGHGVGTLSKVRSAARYAILNANKKYPNIWTEQLQLPPQWDQYLEDYICGA